MNKQLGYVKVDLEGKAFNSMGDLLINSVEPSAVKLKSDKLALPANNGKSV